MKVRFKQSGVLIAVATRTTDDLKKEKERL